jgi:hypothetical protein
MAATPPVVLEPSSDLGSVDPGSEYLPAQPVAPAMAHHIKRTRSQDLSRSDLQRAAHAKRVYVSLFDEAFDLSKPPGVKELSGLEVKNPEPFRNTASPEAKLLIRRGFPLIGIGSASLVFLLDEYRVAKVGRYHPESRGPYEADMCAKHRDERGREVGGMKRHKTCFSDTELVLVVDEIGCGYKMHVQRRVHIPPAWATGGVPDKVLKDKNSDAIRAMLDANPDVKQFGYTYRAETWKVVKKRPVIVIDGNGDQHVEEVEEESEPITRQWIVAYDFH